MLQAALLKALNEEDEAESALSMALISRVSTEQNMTNAKFVQRYSRSPLVRPTPLITSTLTALSPFQDFFDSESPVERLINELAVARGMREEAEEEEKAAEVEMYQAIHRLRDTYSENFSRPPSDPTSNTNPRETTGSE